MDISQKKNINCVHGVSKYSAEEYFLPGHAGSMTLYDEVHSSGLATIQQQCIVSLLQSACYSSCHARNRFHILCMFYILPYIAFSLLL